MVRFIPQVKSFWLPEKVTVTDKTPSPSQKPLLMPELQILAVQPLATSLGSYLYDITGE
jgi:hypothetical protein